MRPGNSLHRPADIGGTRHGEAPVGVARRCPAGPLEAGGVVRQERSQRRPRLAGPARRSPARRGDRRRGPRPRVPRDAGRPSSRSGAWASCAASVSRCRTPGTHGCGRLHPRDGRMAAPNSLGRPLHEGRAGRGPDGGDPTTQVGQDGPLAGILRHECRAHCGGRGLARAVGRDRHGGGLALARGRSERGEAPRCGAQSWAARRRPSRRWSVGTPGGPSDRALGPAERRSVHQAGERRRAPRPACRSPTPPTPVRPGRGPSSAPPGRASGAARSRRGCPWLIVTAVAGAAAAAQHGITGEIGRAAPRRRARRWAGTPRRWGGQSKPLRGRSGRLAGRSGSRCPLGEPLALHPGPDGSGRVAPTPVASAAAEPRGAEADRRSMPSVGRFGRRWEISWPPDPMPRTRRAPRRGAWQRPPTRRSPRPCRPRPPCSGSRPTSAGSPGPPPRTEGPRGPVPAGVGAIPRCALPPRGPSQGRTVNLSRGQGPRLAEHPAGTDPHGRRGRGRPRTARAAAALPGAEAIGPMPQVPQASRSPWPAGDAPSGGDGMPLPVGRLVLADDALRGLPVTGCLSGPARGLRGTARTTPRGPSRAGRGASRRRPGIGGSVGATGARRGFACVWRRMRRGRGTASPTPRPGPGAPPQ